MGALIVDINILIYLLKKNAVFGELLDRKIIYISYLTELALLNFPKITLDKTLLIQDVLYNCRIIPYAEELKETIIRL